MEVLGLGDAGEEDSFAIGARDGFGAVAAGLVAGPEADVLGVVAEVNDEVAAFVSADFVAPPDFQDVASLGFFPRSEIFPGFEIGDEFCGAGAVGIPTTENAVAVFLVDCWEEGFGAAAESFEEDEVGCAGAEAGLGALGVDLDFSFDDSAGGRKEVFRGVAAVVGSAAGHGFDGGEDLRVEVWGLGGRGLRAGTGENSKKENEG